MGIFVSSEQGLVASSLAGIPLRPGSSTHVLALNWALVRGFSLSYHNRETLLLTIDPYCGNLNNIP